MSDKQSIQNQVERTQSWFEIERVQDAVTPKIRVSIAREIQKCMGDNPAPRIKIALLTLVLAGEIENPLNFSKADIENALWLVRDLRIGFNEDAPVAVKYFQ